MQTNTSFRDLPDEPELQMVNFQNLEGRYARATVNVIINDVDQEIDLVDVCVCSSDQDELVETNIIAEEIMTQNP